MVTIDEGRLLVSGRPTTLFGFRVPSAPLRDDWTAELVEQFPLWQKHGINALTIWVQGCSGGFIRAFQEDGAIDSQDEPIRVRANFGGSETTPKYGRSSGAQSLARCKRIVEAARAHEMVVLLGLFYRPALTSDDTTATLAAGARKVASHFAEYDNVIYNVFNEPDSQRALESPEALRTYMQAIGEASPGRLVGTGYRPAGQNHTLAAMDETYLIMMDTGSALEDSIAEFEALRDCGKPVMNVESFAGNGGGYLDDPERSVSGPGTVWVDFEGWRRHFGAWREQDTVDGRDRNCPGRRSYRELIRYVAGSPIGARHLMVHVASWFQGASRVERADQIGRGPGQWDNHFDSGPGSGRGTPAEPGILWLLEEIAQARS